MGILLYIIAILIKRIVELPMYLINSLIALIKGEWNHYNTTLAISLDQYGNGLCQYVFCYLFIKNGGHKFGNIDETISSVLGKNKQSNTLTLAGRVLAYILDGLDPNHVEKSIDKTEN